MRRKQIYKSIYGKLLESSLLQVDSDIEFEQSDRSLNKITQKAYDEQLPKYIVRLAEVRAQIIKLQKEEKELSEIIDVLNKRSEETKNPKWGEDLNMWPIKYKGVFINGANHEIANYSKIDLKYIIDTILKLTDVFGNSKFTNATLWYSGYTGVSFYDTDKHEVFMLLFTQTGHIQVYVQSGTGKRIDKDCKTIEELIDYIDKKF